MIKYIALHTGYVESNSTALMIYECAFFGHQGYESKREAFTEFTKDIYAKYIEEFLNYKSKDEHQFNAEEFMEFFRDLMNSNCDSYGEAEFASNRHLKWWPWPYTSKWLGAPKEEFIYLTEYGEFTLLCALYSIHPELKTEERNDSQDWEKIKNG